MAQNAEYGNSGAQECEKQCSGQSRTEKSLIKRFPQIRRLVENLFVYGINSQEHYDIAYSTFFLLWRKLGLWLQKDEEILSEEEIIQETVADNSETGINGTSIVHLEDDGRRFISADSREYQFNPFYNIFRMKSFTDRDLYLHFFILDLLNDGEKHSFQEIKDFINLSDISEDTLKIKLKEYTDLGIIQKEKKENKFFYSIQQPPDFSEDWANALFFFSETMPLGLLGYYISNNHLSDIQSPFLYKHHYLFPALDSQVLYCLVSAMDSQKAVRITIKQDPRKKEKVEIRQNSGKKTDDNSETIIPAKIYVSARSGREYVLAYKCTGKVFCFIRLDHIEKAEAMEKAENFSDVKAKATKLEKNFWGVSGNPEYPKEHLEMKIRILDDEEFVLRRLIRERRNGTVKKENENTYVYSVNATDCREMIPWIRTFIGRITSLKCTQKIVIERIKNCLKESCEKYGVNCNE